MSRVFYILVSVLIAGYLAWPYASLYGLYADLKANDEEGVDGRVLWPVLREGFRTDIDRFAKAATNKNLQSGQIKITGATVTLTWDSISASDKIAQVFATPRGLISLFENPSILKCTLKAVKSSDIGSIESCLNKQKAVRAPEIKTAPLQGPNLSRLFEKFEFAFFTGFLSFRFSVVHEGTLVTLDFIRKTEGWMLTRLSLPLDRLLNKN